MPHSRIETLGLILLAALLAPYLLLRARRKPLAPPARILVIPQLSRVGDLVCATPVFRAIKEHYPEARLTVVVSKKAAGVVRHNPRIDELLCVEDYSFFALARRLARERFDWSLSLVPTAPHALLALFAGIPGRVKTTRRPRPVTEWLSDWMSNRPIRYEHHAFLPGHYVRTLAPLGISRAQAAPEVFSTPEGERKADALFAGHTSADMRIGISITAGNKIKEWGDERFVELARAIHARYGASVVFIGGPADASRVANAVAKAGPGALAATDFSLEELPALLARLKLFIAVDTGPIYMAHALGTPLIDIIGPVDPSEQPPKDERSLQVLPAAGIAPSSFVFKRPGPATAHQRAIDSIAVAQVLAAVETLLGAPSP